MKKEKIEKIIDGLWGVIVIVLVLVLFIGNAVFLWFKDKNTPYNFKIYELWVYLQKDR